MASKNGSQFTDKVSDERTDFKRGQAEIKGRFRVDRHTPTNSRDSQRQIMLVDGKLRNMTNWQRTTERGGQYIGTHIYGRRRCRT